MKNSFLKTASIAFSLCCLSCGGACGAPQTAGSAPKSGAIILKFASKGEIGTVANVGERASYLDEHPPGNKILVAHDTIKLSGPYYAFKSRDFMGIAALSSVLNSLPPERLTSLDLSNTLVSDQDLSILTRFKGLRRLDLENTDITEKGLGQLSCLSQLESLSVRKTKVTGSFLKIFSACKNMKRLCLGNNDIDLKFLPDLKLFGKLVWLEISQIHLRDSDLALLNNFPELVELHIADNNLLDDRGLANIKNLKHLTTLRCEGTNITASGLMGLKAPLKGIHIEPRQIGKGQEALLLKTFPGLSISKDERRKEYFDIYKELTE